MSDHNFRHFIAKSPKSQLAVSCRVPLIIHLPGQQTRYDVEAPFSTAYLGTMLTNYRDKICPPCDFLDKCLPSGSDDIVLTDGASLYRLNGNQKVVRMKQKPVDSRTRSQGGVRQ